MDVFARYLFTYCVQKIEAQTIVGVLAGINHINAFLPATIVTHKYTQSMSDVMADTIRVSAKQLKHAATKHA